MTQAQETRVSPEPVSGRAELLHQLFEAAAGRFPDAVAVEFGESRLTYRELERRADRIAHWLRARGAGPDDRVALWLPRSENVYAAMLGILKSGAAYVPIDPQTPADRVAFMLEDSGAKCLVSDSSLLGGLALAQGLALLRLDRDGAEFERFDDVHPPPQPSPARGEGERGEARPDNLCCVIYTSGTTGRPKGVMLEHRNVVALVRAEAGLYGARSDDRVFQLASAAFDASIEEIWLAFLQGATLVAATDELRRPGPEFCRELDRLGVTILSCVPTFLSMIEGDLRRVRVLILGGEACPADLAARWLRPGRALFNTYGPTEATVIATAALLEQGRPVTIGRPIEGYSAYLLDPNLEPVPAGVEGEIFLGGTGVARGYLNRPELEAEKFIVTDNLTGLPVRLYRTGDLARASAGGELEYLGRADDQVKLRGYRVELTEIEACLVECPGVLAAAASVHPATQRIAAYVVRRSGVALDRARLRDALARRLAPYMVPAFLDEVDELPMTVSGKIDRRRLPPASTPLADGRGALVAPRTDAERTIVKAWEAVLGRDGISVNDDFFLDLDGHSMLAALAVSRLRRERGFEGLSIADLYAKPTVEKLAALFSGERKNGQSSAPKPSAFYSAPAWKYAACTAGQAMGILFVSGIYAWQWLGAFLAYGYLVVMDWSVREALVIALLVYLVTTPVVLLLSIALKWLLLGRVRPGEYPLWGWFYWRFWFVRAVVRAAPVNHLAGTPLINWYYRLMGAKIGRDVFIASDGTTAFDALTVGDGASIGSDTMADGGSVEGGRLRIAPVSIGRGVWIGNRCSVGGGVVMEDASGLGDLSMLPDRTRVPAGELWQGSPARPAGRLEPMVSRPPWNAGSALAHLVGVFLFPLLTMGAIFPGLMVITHLGHQDPGFRFLVAAPLVAASFVFFLCLEVWAFKRLLLGRLREGRYPVGGGFYARKWFFDQMMDLSLEVTGTLYTTMYLAPWLRALGARLGPRSEISTIRFLHPDLLSAGAECFLADDVLVGGQRVRGGFVDIGRTRLGDRTFVGNSAILPAGVAVGSNVLIGTLSAPPASAKGSVPDGTAWFGSPAILLPARQKAAGFSEEQTYRPPPRLVALRLSIEFFRVLLPSTIFVVLASLIMNATDILQDYVGLGDWLLLVPVLYAAAGALAALAVVGLKRALIGRYRPGEHPLWCGFVWLSELVTGLYENLAVLFFVDLLRGTPFIAWVLRSLGVKVGRRCYIDTTWFSEFDLVEIGDEAELNEDANIQTHLFEDRVMKSGRVRIGRRAVVGSMSTMLYDTELGDGSSLGALSLQMKGERLEPATRWHGIPARRE